MELIELLSYIKQRPQMYLRKSNLEQLEAFLGGYQLAQTLYKNSNSEEVLRKDFVQFLVKKYNEVETSWYEMVINIAAINQKDAFEIFFELIEEFETENK